MPSARRLGARSGLALEWLIQQWVRQSGRRVRADDVPWLGGPIGTSRIGADFYERFAAQAGLDVTIATTGAGLIPDFTCLRGGTFDPERVDEAIRQFYERTSDYTLDVWSQWSGVLQPFARTLITVVSRNIEQLNLPLSPLETSRGMGSDIVLLTDKATGQLAYTGWLRHTTSTRSVIYAGFYTTCLPPRAGGPCVKVVFPLPLGSATVILRPANQDDGSFKLISSGGGFGGPGYYRIHRADDTTLRVKNVPLTETIHVYRDDHGVLRTDHIFKFWNMVFLKLHYKITPK